MSKIKVLIVDDSRMIRDVLTDILKEHDDIEVVGAAADAFQARDMISKKEQRKYLQIIAIVGAIVLVVILAVQMLTR